MERVLKHCRRMILAKKQPQRFVAINERFLQSIVLVNPISAIEVPIRKLTQMASRRSTVKLHYN
jgi:hypothetical protein